MSVPFYVSGKGKWIIGAVAVFTVISLFGHYRLRSRYICRYCWADKLQYQWFLGSWMDGSIPISPASVTITDEHRLDHLLPPNHEHEWILSQESPFAFFGSRWYGCGLGPAQHHSTISQQYIHEGPGSEFRLFMEQKFPDKAQLLAILAIPSTDSNWQERDERAAAIMDEFIEWSLNRDQAATKN